jgi:DNA (cytosine-5)-methyltransferase 1
MTTYPERLTRELPQKAPARNGLKLASLFCGAGGVDLGFRSAGWELAYANDYNAEAARSFALNLGHQPEVGDVRAVKGERIGKVDVLTGGFPCVTFSTAGARAGVNDDIHGKLYLEMCRVITEVQPRIFVAENVRGMLSANGGAAVKLVLAAFLRMGYRTAYELVNMAEHGVPQTRERVIFVGVRNDCWQGAFRFPSPTHRLAKEKRRERMTLPPAVSLREAIGDLPAPSDVELNPHGARNFASAMRAASSEAPSPTVLATNEGGDAPFINAHQANHYKASPKSNVSSRTAAASAPSPSIIAGGEVPGNNSPFVLAARNPDFHNPPRAADEPCVTMTAGGQSELANASGWRRMTARECARVQSFPDWYTFLETQADAYRQIGNAVPPLYARKLALAIEDYFRRGSKP